MSNFDFLTSGWNSIFQKLKKAEQRVFTEPVSTASYCRMVLEESIYAIYNLEFIELPYNKELVNLMTNEELKNVVPDKCLSDLHIVRKIGNNAAHFGTRISSNDALVSIKYIYSFLKWFAGEYSETVPEIPGAFDESFIPKIGDSQRKLKELQKEREREEKDLLERIEKQEEEKRLLLLEAQENEQALTEYKRREEELKEALQLRKQERLAKYSSEFTEAETRKHIIDADLNEAGWTKLRDGYELEYPVKGMPVTTDNPKGNGFADYVLWDDNGKPLAVIEAKRTSRDVELGRHQARLYADCLEMMHGQRPVIFYTNGYETKLWDDVFYSTPRRVFGFYSKEELQFLIQQRDTRGDIRNATVDKDIAGRHYQIEAIQRVAESFVTGVNGSLRGDKRRALLVMATGSGKTRTAAALIDVLFKHNWVKRVLFLADRNALVSQAKKSFGNHLPNLTSIDLTCEKENNTTRLVFSTYQSMINKIDKEWNNNERFYGIGHFDLIIIDEAHRSVYNKYRAIFEYFDAIIVGLTATPKNGIHHNTFEIMDCAGNDPTFEYPLEEAVPTYLKTYKNIDISTGFIREGIKYNELPEKDKLEYEDTFGDKATGLFPEEIPASKMNKTLFNKDTVNKILDTLMTKGLKIEGGDKLGRTIIFAVNQKHAEFIVDCFTERYPDMPSGFIAMVHNKVSHAQSIIDAFCDEHKENNPQIAVSVDMMDTGIDAPRVLNLVFFKVVRSFAKFWQMIGRGTRLCPDVYGPDRPKEHFLIFDVCKNFEFFEAETIKSEDDVVKPVTQQIFETRLQLSRLLAETGLEENIELSVSLLDKLHAAVSGLNKSDFRVAMASRYVDKFSDRSVWDNLSAEDVHEIETYLSALPAPEATNERTRLFDLMMLKLQQTNLLSKGNEKKYYERLINLAEDLSKKYTITEVARSRTLIEDMKDPDFYKKLSQKKLDEIRVEIRDLVKHLDKNNSKVVYTNFSDSVVTVNEAEGQYLQPTNEIYKRRVEKFIRENRHNVTISKLASNIPITREEVQVLENILFDGEERGTKEDYIKEYGEKPLGEFIRSIIGLDIDTANKAFAEFIQVGNLTADQMNFINSIISFLNKNGKIDKSLLFEPPFTDLHDQGLLGFFDEAEARKIISIIDEINENVIVG